MEIWKDIKGYEGLYQVSNLGRVKSLRYNKEKILSNMVDTGGYQYVHLYNENIKKKKYRLHRLVGKSFLINEDNLREVHHKNAIKTDNRVVNLEWCTRQDNERFKKGLGSIHAFSKLMKAEVSRIVIF